jgi:nitrate/nitrite transporter NarK
MPGSTLVNHWFARQRTLAITLSHLGAETGGTLLTPLLALLVLNVGWRQAAVLSGLAFLIVVPLLTLIVRDRPELMGLRPDGAPPRAEHPPPRPRGEGAGASGGDAKAQPVTTRRSEDFAVREALATRSFWQLALAIGARQFSKQVLSVHLIPLLVWKGIEEQTAALLLGLFAFSQIPLRIAAAQLADRWSMPKVAGLSALSGVGAVAVLLLGEGSWLGIGVLFAFLFALAETGNSAGWAAIGDFFGREKYATIRGAVSMVHSAISLPAPVLAGWVYDTTQSYQLALVPVAASYAIAFGLFWALQRPQPRF